MVVVTALTFLYYLQAESYIRDGCVDVAAGPYLERLALVVASASAALFA